MGYDTIIIIIIITIIIIIIIIKKPTFDVTLHTRLEFCCTIFGNPRASL